MAAPTDFTGLKLWLKADSGVYVDAGTTLATTGQTVQQWNDQSGSGNHVTQATSGNRPVYTTGQLNGLPGLAFDGTNDALTIATPVQTTTIYTLFAVVRTGAALTGGRTFLHVGSASGYDLELSGANRVISHRGVASLTDGATSASTDELWSAVRASTPLTRLFIQGVAQTVSGSTSGAGVPATATSIGSRDNGSANFWNGRIYEIAVYDNTLSDANRGAIEAYLLAKWFGVLVAGQSNGAASAVGDITTGSAGVSVSGTASGFGAASGSFTAVDPSPISVAGNASGVGSAAGAITVTNVLPVSVAGASFGIGSASGAITSPAPAPVSIAGNAFGAGSATGSITEEDAAPVSVSGSASGVGSATGALSVSAAGGVLVSGSAAGTGSVTGALNVVAPSPVTVSGTAQGIGSAAGGITAEPPIAAILAGNCFGVSSGTGSLTVTGGTGNVVILSGNRYTRIAGRRTENTISGSGSRRGTVKAISGRRIDRAISGRQVNG